MLRFLFPYKSYSASMSILLLLLRLLFGSLLMWHGLTKIADFDTIAAAFPNPLGLGSRLSLYLTIFAEVFCSVGVILGVLYRLALIPIIFSMGVAFFVVHANDLFAIKELALIYLIIFILLFVMGAGRYAFDNIIAALIHKDDAAMVVNASESV